MDGFYEKVQQSAEYILSHSTLRPTCGIVLGSGLGSLVDKMTDKTIIPYADIPHFPRSTVAGHAGNLVLGTLAGQTVAALQGRFHYYEGFSMRQVTYPVYVLRLLGVRTLVITNACGGIDRGLAPGELMLLSDYINMLGSNSLMGPNDERFGPRFPDMTEAYSLRLRALANLPPPNWESPARRGSTPSSLVPATRPPPRSEPIGPWGRMPSACPLCRKPSPPTTWGWRCWALPASPTWPPASQKESIPTRRSWLWPTGPAQICAAW